MTRTVWVGATLLALGCASGKWATRMKAASAPDAIVSAAGKCDGGDMMNGCAPLVSYLESKDRAAAIEAATDACNMGTTGAEHICGMAEQLKKEK